MTTLLLLIIVLLLCWIIEPVRCALLLVALAFKWNWDHRFLPHPWYGSRAFYWRAFDQDPANRKKLDRYIRHGGKRASAP